MRNRRLIAFLCFIGLSACTTELDTDVSSTGIGDFSLSEVVVVVDGPAQGVLSRTASDETLRIAIKDSLSTRFARFDGGGNHIIGVKVAGYVLAQPGIPVLLAPRSVLAMNVNVYEVDGTRINTDVRRVTVFEDYGGDTVVGSGFTQSAEEQLKELADNAAIEIEKWLRENPDWFTPAPAPIFPEAPTNPEA